MRALLPPWQLVAVLVVLGSLGSHPAAQRSAISSSYTCADAHLGAAADAACDLACRRRIGGALITLYQALSGQPDAGPWRHVDAASMCSSGCAFNGTLLPSYCCWPGVFCCMEFSTASGRGSSGNSSAAAAAAAACGPVDATVLELAMRDFGLTGRLQDARVLASLALLNSFGLHSLDVSSNTIDGTIPAALGGLANLTTINMNLNHLRGTLPREVGRLPKLLHFHASFNRLSGDLDGRFCSLPGAPLAILSLRANQFEGSASMGPCTQLRVLDLQDNRLAGPLPVDSRNQQLISIRVSNNAFSGSISEDIWRLPELTTIDASNNDLTGSISPYCGSSNNLIQVLLGNNSLHGPVPGNLTSNSQLLMLSLHDNPGIMGTMPNSKSMVGLRNLDLHNTALSGTIPEVWGSLPYLESVDISNTRMSCCASQAEADERAARGVNSLVPPFLEFGGLLRQFDTASNQEEHAGTPTGASDVLCGTVTRRQQPPSVWNTFNLPVTNDAVATQRWTVGPLYSWFKNCTCPPGYRQDGTELFMPMQAWCGAGGTSPGAPPSSCVDMHIPRCVAVGPPELSAGGKAGIAVAVAIAALLLVLAANQSLARASKLRRYYVRAKTRLAGAPKHGRLSLVVTDIEGYSDIFKRSPEVMFRALLLHNSVIRAAKYDNCGFVLEQEGDSFTLAFYDAFDAAAFCLQVQQALLTVHWPAGLDEPPELGNSNSIVSRKPSKLQLRLSSLLASGPGARKKPMRSGASATLSEGEPHHLGATPSGLLAAPSRLALFSGRTPAASTGYGGDPPLFAGLRVRMGVVTGVVPSGTPIKSSALFQLAKVVSDFGNGGQVLVDHTTFEAVKEDLRVLGAVEAGGLNHGKLASGRGLWAAAKALLGCTSGPAAEEALVIDMGAYATGLTDGCEPPYATGDHELAAGGDDDARAAPDWGCGGGPLGWLRRRQHSSGGGASSFSGSDSMHDGCVVGAHVGGGAAGSGSDAAMRSGGSLRSLSRLLSTCTGASPELSELATTGAACQQQQQQLGPQVASSTSSATSPGADAAAAAAPPARSGGIAGPLSFTAGVTALKRQLSTTGRSLGRPASLQRSGTSARRREWDSVRLFQVLPPALAQRAHVWHNNLSIPAGWCCWDTPYFDAPGSTVVPLATSTADSLLQGSSTALLSHSASTRPGGGLGMRASSVASSLDREPPAPLPSRAASFAPQLLAGCPLPPVTMVFMGVDHCDSLVKRRRSFAPKVAGLLGRVVRDALRRTGGYLCRVQEGELKFMLAFGSPVSALEWCLVVQEAAMFLPWPSESVLLYDGCTLERDAQGRVVLRGPRIKMGVCEGVPKSILPDHEGRADFHGPSINMAARYMGQAAGGGQIACSLELAERVMGYWARCAAGGGAGGGRGSTGGGSNNGGACAQPQQQEQQEQQQQQALEQEAEAAEPSFSGGMLQAEQQPQHGNAVPPTPLQLSSSSGGAASAGNLFDALVWRGSSSGNGPQGVPAWSSRGQQGGTHAARRQGCQQLDSIDSSGSDAVLEVVQQQQQWSSRGGAQQRASTGSLQQHHQQHQQQQVPLTRLQAARPSQTGPAQAAAAWAPGAAAGVVPPPPPTSKFVLPSVPLSLAAVEVHRLGLYAFKGGPPQQEMVQVLLSHLAGRVAVSSSAAASAAAARAPPSRKGQQLRKLEGRIGDPVAVELPALANEYRAKLPERGLADQSAAGRLALQRSHTSLTRQREQLSPALSAPHTLHHSSSFSDARGSTAAHAARLALAPPLLQCGAPAGGVQFFSDDGDARASPAGGGGGSGGVMARQRAVSDPAGSVGHSECLSITVEADAPAQPPTRRAKQQQDRTSLGERPAAAAVHLPGGGAGSALLRHDSFGSVASGEMAAEEESGPARVKSGPSPGQPAVGVALLAQLQDVVGGSN